MLNRPAGSLVAETCELKAPWSARAVKRKALMRPSASAASSPVPW